MKEISIPEDLKKALTTAPSAISLWDSLTPIARRDFITWIDEAKQKETRLRRITITRDKLLTGKRRPCCYAVVPMNFYTALGKNPQAKAVWKELTPDKRRDLVDQINSAQDSAERTLRIDKICTTLASKK